MLQHDRRRNPPKELFHSQQGQASGGKRKAVSTHLYARVVTRVPHVATVYRYPNQRLTHTHILSLSLSTMFIPPQHFSMTNYDLGAPQDVVEGKTTNPMEIGVQQWYRETLSYVRDHVVGVPELQDKLHLCRNRRFKCTYWAARGECNVNPGFMLSACMPACRACHSVLGMDGVDLEALEKEKMEGKTMSEA